MDPSSTTRSGTLRNAPDDSGTHLVVCNVEGTPIDADVAGLLDGTSVDRGRSGTGSADAEPSDRTVAIAAPSLDARTGSDTTSVTLTRIIIIYPCSVVSRRIL